MDEATSALDEMSQARLMRFLRTDLAEATVLSVGHRPGLEQYHDRDIHLVRGDGHGAGWVSAPSPRCRLTPAAAKEPCPASALTEWLPHSRQSG